MHRLLPVLGFLVLLSACEKAFFQAEPENNPEALFENLYTSFVENYGPTAERNIPWDSLYALYRPQVTAGSTDDQLFSVITAMLAHLDDGHVSLTAPGRPIFNANHRRNLKIDDDLFNLDNILTNYLEDDYRTGSDTGYVYGKIRNENIGYAYFDYVADNFFVLDEFLDANATSDGIIIDLRHNQGGDFTYSFSSMGRLTDTDRFVYRSRTKNGPGPDDFTEWYDWHLEPGGSHYAKPIVVLIDRYTISAGERTVMALMTLPNVTMIGDTTSGAHATAIGRELANGWYYSLATQNTLLFDGKTYEGIGLPPDIRFMNEQADVDAGLDKTLERAIAEF